MSIARVEIVILKNNLTKLLFTSLYVLFADFLHSVYDRLRHQREAEVFQSVMKGWVQGDIYIVCYSGGEQRDLLEFVDKHLKNDPIVAHLPRR